MALLGGVGVFASLCRAVQLVVKQQGGFWGAVELENGIPVREGGGGVGVRVAMATRLCLTDASCKSVWKREGPFVFGRVEWASLKLSCGKRALERAWEGDGTGRPQGARQRWVPGGRRGAGGAGRCRREELKNTSLSSGGRGGEEMGGSFQSYLKWLGSVLAPWAPKGCSRNRRGLQKGDGNNHT